MDARIKENAFGFAAIVDYRDPATGESRRLYSGSLETQEDADAKLAQLIEQARAGG